MVIQSIWLTHSTTMIVAIWLSDNYLWEYVPRNHAGQPNLVAKSMNEKTNRTRLSKWKQYNAESMQSILRNRFSSRISSTSIFFLFVQRFVRRFQVLINKVITSGFAGTNRELSEWEGRNYVLEQFVYFTWLHTYRPYIAPSTHHVWMGAAWGPGPKILYQNSEKINYAHSSRNPYNNIMNMKGRGGRIA